MLDLDSDDARVSDGPDPLAGFPVAPPPLRRPVLFDQTWVDLTFIHWPVRRTPSRACTRREHGPTSSPTA